jgi:hypothetical protein
MRRQLSGILSLAGACLLAYGCSSNNGGNSQTGTGGAAQAGGVTGPSGSGGQSGGNGGAMTGGRSGSGGATSGGSVGAGGSVGSGGSVGAGGGVGSGGVSSGGGRAQSGGSGAGGMTGTGGSGAGGGGGSGGSSAGGAGSGGAVAGQGGSVGSGGANAGGSTGSGSSAAGSGGSVQTGGTSGGSGGSTSDPVTPTSASNKYKFSFGDVVMEIDATVGARVTTLTLGGTNLIMPLATDLTACSSTFWTSPRSDWTPGTSDWPPPVAIDNGPYDGSISGTHALFKGSKDPTMGVSIDKDFSADAGTGWISITYTINTTNAIKAAPWEVTRVPRGGIAFFPSGAQAMTNGPWKTVTQGNGITWVDDTAKTTTSPDGGKAYGDGTGGWFAYVVGGNLFLKKFTDTPANQQAPNDGEVSVYSGTGFLEFELQGPYGSIAAGGKQTWSVRWRVVKIPNSVTVAVGNASLSDFAAAQAVM